MQPIRGPGVMNPGSPQYSQFRIRGAMRDYFSRVNAPVYYDQQTQLMHPQVTHQLIHPQVQLIPTFQTASPSLPVCLPSQWINFGVAPPGMPGLPTQGMLAHPTQGIPGHPTQGMPGHPTQGMPGLPTQGMSGPPTPCEVEPVEMTSAVPEAEKNNLKKDSVDAIEEFQRRFEQHGIATGLSPRSSSLPLTLSPLNTDQCALTSGVPATLPSNAAKTLGNVAISTMSSNAAKTSGDVATTPLNAVQISDGVVIPFMPVNAVQISDVVVTPDMSLNAVQLSDVMVTPSMSFNAPQISDATPTMSLNAVQISDCLVTPAMLWNRVQTSNVVMTPSSSANQLVLMTSCPGPSVTSATTAVSNSVTPATSASTRPAGTSTTLAVAAAAAAAAAEEEEDEDATLMNETKIIINVPAKILSQDKPGDALQKGGMRPSSSLSTQSVHSLSATSPEFIPLGPSFNWVHSMPEGVPSLRTPSVKSFSSIETRSSRSLAVQNDGMEIDATFVSLDARKSVSRSSTAMTVDAACQTVSTAISYDVLTFNVSTSTDDLPTKFQKIDIGVNTDDQDTQLKKDFPSRSSSRNSARFQENNSQRDVENSQRISALDTTSSVKSTIVNNTRSSFNACDVYSSDENFDELEDSDEGVAKSDLKIEGGSVSQQIDGVPADMKSLTVFAPAGENSMFSANLAPAEEEPLPMWASAEEQPPSAKIQLSETEQPPSAKIQLSEVEPPPSAKIQLSEARQSAQIETFEPAIEAKFEPPVEESSKDVKIESSNGSCNGDHHSVHSSARSSTAVSTKDNCVTVTENGDHPYADSLAPIASDGCAVQSRKPPGLEHIGDKTWLKDKPKTAHSHIETGRQVPWKSTGVGSASAVGDFRGSERSLSPSKLQKPSHMPEITDPIELNEMYMSDEEVCSAEQPANGNPDTSGKVSLSDKTGFRGALSDVGSAAEISASAPCQSTAEEVRQAQAIQLQLMQFAQMNPLLCQQLQLQLLQSDPSLAIDPSRLQLKLMDSLHQLLKQQFEKQQQLMAAQLQQQFQPQQLVAAQFQQQQQLQQQQLMIAQHQQQLQQQQLQQQQLDSTITTSSLARPPPGMQMLPPKINQGSAESFSGSSSGIHGPVHTEMKKETTYAKSCIFYDGRETKVQATVDRGLDKEDIPGVEKSEVKQRPRLGTFRSGETKAESVDVTPAVVKSTSSASYASVSATKPDKTTDLRVSTASSGNNSSFAGASARTSAGFKPESHLTETTVRRMTGRGRVFNPESMQGGGATGGGGASFKGSGGAASFGVGASFGGGATYGGGANFGGAVSSGDGVIRGRNKLPPGEDWDAEIAEDAEANWPKHFSYYKPPSKKK